MSQAGQLLLGVFDGHGAQGRPVAHLVRDAIPMALEKVRHRATSPTASDNSSSSGDTTLHADGTAAEAAETAAADGAVAPNGRSKKKPTGAGSAADGSDRADIHASRANALRAAFTSAETVVRRSGVDHVFSGTTAVVAWLFGSEMYVAWVGDSRCSVGRAIVGGDSLAAGGAGAGAGGAPFAAGAPASPASSAGSPAPPSASSAASAAAVARRQRFRAVDVSHDQKPVRADEKKRVRDAGGRVARWRRNMGPLRVWQKDEWVPGLAMTRSIGDTCLSDCGVIPTPEVAYVRLNGADSFVVLASDGVWYVVRGREWRGWDVKWLARPRGCRGGGFGCLCCPAVSGRPTGNRWMCFCLRAPEPCRVIVWLYGLLTFVSCALFSCQHCCFLHAPSFTPSLVFRGHATGSS